MQNKNLSNCWKLLIALNTKCKNFKDWTISSQALDIAGFKEIAPKKVQRLVERRKIVNYLKR